MTARRLKIYALLSAVLTLIYLVVHGTDSRSEKSAELVYNKPSLTEIESDPGAPTTRRMSLNARSVLVVDNHTGAWLYAKRALEARPIASLTKLLTAMVYLDMKPNLDTVVYISNRDCYKSAKSHLRRGEAYKAIDLLHIALMASDNRAARALATASGLPRQIFIECMNIKARQLGMMNTTVVEVTGLSEGNISTAADVAILVNAAMKYKLIKEITSKYRLRVKVQNKRRYKNYVNTNRMVLSKWRVLAGKTGFIRESDYCLATVLRDKQSRELTVVVLGSPTNNTRFRVARQLAVFGFKHAGRNTNGTQIARR